MSITALVRAAPLRRGAEGNAVTALQLALRTAGQVSRAAAIASAAANSPTWST